MRELSDGEKNIIRNLRYEYGDKVAHIEDRELVRKYNEWNTSDKSEPCLDWLLD
jgi:hypothetical protein